MFWLKASRLRWACALMAFAAAAAAVPAHAALITYSGPGTIEKVSAGSTDPWGIGNTPLPITYSVVLDDAVPDGNENVNVATWFDIHSGSFVVNGLPAVFQDAGAGSEGISFGDNEFGIGDSFAARFVANRNGVDQNILISYFMNNATFAFSNSIEPPPVYGDQTPLSASSGIGNESSYRVTIGANSTQSAAVPEPASAVALAAAAGAGLIRRKRLAS